MQCWEGKGREAGQWDELVHALLGREGHGSGAVAACMMSVLHAPAGFLGANMHECKLD